MRIVQLSDTHLSAAGGVTRSNFERVADFVNRTLRPDLIVHTGDAVALSPDEAGDRATARQAHELLDAPLRLLPGNHDIGEPGSGPWMGIEVTMERLLIHRETFGTDCFAESFGNWALLGLNTELLGSGLPAEEEQWRWLDQALRTSIGKQVVVFAHKPLWLPRRTPSEAALTIPLRSRRRLLSRLQASTTLRAVGSGHLHRYRQRQRAGLLEVWAPSTGFVVRRPLLPLSRLGILEWRFDRGDLAVSLHQPPGLEEREAVEIPELTAGLARLTGKRTSRPAVAS